MDNILLQAILLSGSGKEIGSAQESVREYAELQQQTTPEEKQEVQEKKKVKEMEQKVPEEKESKKEEKKVEEKKD